MVNNVQNTIPVYVGDHNIDVVGRFAGDLGLDPCNGLAKLICSLVSEPHYAGAAAHCRAALQGKKVLRRIAYYRSMYKLPRAIHKVEQRFSDGTNTKVTRLYCPPANNHF